MHQPFDPAVAGATSLRPQDSMDPGADRCRDGRRITARSVELEAARALTGRSRHALRFLAAAYPNPDDLVGKAPPDDARRGNQLKPENDGS